MLNQIARVDTLSNSQLDGQKDGKKEKKDPNFIDKKNLFFGDQEQLAQNARKQSNHIKTTKYSLITFLPLSLLY